MAMPQNGDRPGILEMLRSVVAAPFEERVARQQWARTERLRLEAQAMMLSAAVRRVTPDDDGFVPVGSDTARGSLDETTSEELRNQARKHARESTHVRGYLRTLERFVMGAGVDFDPQIDDDSGVDRDEVMAWWKLCKRINDWNTLEDEIVARTWRDGEFFLHFDEQEPGDDEVPISTKAVSYLQKLGFSTDDIDLPAVPDGMTIMRLLPPEHIRDPESVVSHGIVTVEGDVQRPLAYLFAPSSARRVETVIPVQDMMHRKINVDSDAKRGRSQVEVILKRNKQYEDWLNSRITLSYVRSAVALIRKIEGATTGQFTDVTRKYEATGDSSTTNKQKALKPGSVVSEGPGITWRFESPNLQAQDAQHDGRSILLSMAAGTGMPEFIFTADSQNMNMATALVAESPGVREFEDWQDYFRPIFEEIFRRVLRAAARAEAIAGLSVEMVDEMEIQVNFPPMIAREEKAHTESNAIRHEHGILSREGWARDDGINWDTEKERIRQETVDDLDFGGDPTGEGTEEGWPRGHAGEEGHDPDGGVEREPVPV